MDALLILHQLLNWYGGVQVKATQGHDQLVFSGRFFPFPYHTSFCPAVSRGDSPQSPPFLCLPFSHSPTPPSPQRSPFRLPPLCCGVTACRCCVRGVQLALCGLSVWSPLSPEAANRVDEREQYCLL